MNFLNLNSNVSAMKVRILSLFTVLTQVLTVAPIRLLLKKMY